ncbi:MAG TPA: FGGY family carbohydrate kinase [Candidatus Kapabacteria bacterium]|jgi:sedoheptulokinase|nr:FGGY family carbohydrate kinase [Candidatus Kapabacteria bacterium]
MSAVIGIDIGSSAIKGVLFEPINDRILHIERKEIASRIATPNAGQFEEDPVLLRDSIFEIIRKLSAYADRGSEKISGIAFTAQMHGGLLVDERLSPLTNIITWQDKRGDETAKNGKTYVETLRELMQHDPTGVGIHTGFLAATLYWLNANRVFPKGASKVLGIHDWLASLLVGSAVADITSAAAWGMYDIVDHGWRRDVISAMEIGEEILPEIAEPGTDIGKIDSSIAKELDLPENAHVHAGIGDTQASYLGAECTEDEILLNFGTGSQSMWQTQSSSITDAIATAGTDIRYFSHGRYLVTVPTLAGGKAYRVMAEFFQSVVSAFAETEISLDRMYSVMERIAAAVSQPDSGGIHLDPIFSGSKFRDERDRATIAGITDTNFTAANVASALIEGMIEEVAKPYFEREGKIRHIRLVGAGNGLRNNQALREAAERRFGLPMRLSKFEEEAAVGAAKLAI